MERERVHRKTRVFESETRESQTRESRRVEVINAEFKTRVQARDEKNIDAVISSAPC